MRHNLLTILLLSLCLLCGVTPGFAAPSDLEQELREAPRREIAHGEDCIVCGAELDDVAGSFVLEIQGVRIPISTKHFEALLQNPQRYLAQIVLGSLPEGNNRTRRPLPPPTWLGLGLLVLGALVFGGLAAYGAHRKGLAPGPWFLVGFLANVVSLFLLSMQKSEVRPVTHSDAPSPS